jgi:HSP20 family protein
MALVRFDPFRDLAVLQDRMNRLFNEAYNPRQSDDLMSRGTWTPAVDIYEVEGALVLKAELPDMRREDIDVSVENNMLTIRGERKLDGEIKQENFHRIERA